MSTLNPTEIKVLNETQLDNSKSVLDQPIFFSNEFKNFLKPNQRLDLCNLRIMSLRKNKILKDPKGRIEMENLNYDALYSKNSQNTLTDIKNYFITNKIIKNWETSKTNKNPIIKPQQFVTEGNILATSENLTKLINDNPHAKSEKNIESHAIKELDHELEESGHINRTLSNAHNSSQMKENIEHFDYLETTNKDIEKLRRKFKTVLQEYYEKNNLKETLDLDKYKIDKLLSELEFNEIEILTENPDMLIEFLKNSEEESEYSKEDDDVENTESNNNDNGNK